MDNVIRITFPSFSRLQDSPEHLKKALEKTFFALSFAIFPAVVILITVFPHLVTIIPKYRKWEPALLSLAFFAINAAFSSISTPITNLFNALGKIKISLNLMIFWTCATWILTPILIFTIGFNGFALASAIISTSAIMVAMIAKKYIKFEVFPSIRTPFFASIISLLITLIAGRFGGESIVKFISLGLICGISYLTFAFALGRKELIASYQTIKEQFKK